MADVFISYSRRDQDFVRRLHAALEAAGRDAWVDWEGIPPTAKWMDEVRVAIDAANAFVYVVSPDSAGSPVCRQEAEHAAASGKRVVPIVWRDVPEGTLPEAVSAHNWLFMRETDDFAAGMVTLLAALDTDLEWVHAHTRLVTRAREWEANRRERSYLLRGRDLDAAERQLSSAAHRNPSPTPLQTEYVFASRQAERRGQRIRSLALSGGLVAALVLAGFALIQLQEAITQRGRAEDATRQAAANATDANQQRQQADANATDANTQRQQADANATDANTQRQQADANATDANLQRQVAQANATDANTQQQVAEKEATLAQARELTAAADGQLARDPELSVLLATKAVALVQDTNTDRALREALGTSRVRARYLGHTDEVKSVDFTMDGTRFVTASADGTLRLWDTATASTVQTFPVADSAPEHGAISPDGSLVAAASDDGSITVWKSAGDHVTRWTAHQGRATDVAFSPDGTRLLSAGLDGAATLWDTKDWHPVLSVPKVLDDQMTSATFTPDGTQFLTTNADLTVRLWDSATGALVREYIGNTRTPFDAVMSPDGSLIASAAQDETARVWDAKSGTQLQVLAHSGEVYGVAFSPDGLTLATAGSEGKARLWNPQTGDQLLELDGHDGSINALAYDPNGPLLVTAGRDRTVRAWATSAVVPEVRYTGLPGSIIAGDISRDGTRVATTGGNDGLVIVFQAQSGSVISKMRAGPEPISSIEFSPDASTVLTAGYDHTARVWDAATGTQRLELDGHTDVVTSALYSPDGSRIATTSADDTLRMWDNAGAQAWVATFDDQPEDAAFSPDGRHIFGGDASGTVAEYDVATGSQLLRFTTGAGIQSMAMSPDGTRLAVLGFDARTQIWDVASQSVVLELAAQSGFGWSVRYSPDGTRITTGGEDGAIHVWDALTGELLADLQVDPRDAFIGEFGPDERHMLVTTRTSQAVLVACDLCGSTADIVALAATRVTRDLTEEEHVTFLHETPTTAVASPAPEASPSPGPTPSPEASPTPAASEPPASPAPPTSTPGNCTLGDGPCAVDAGLYQTELFQPALSFDMPTTGTEFGENQTVMWFAFDSGDQMGMLESAGFRGADGRSALPIGGKAKDIVAYFRSKSWMILSGEQTVTVDGHSGTQFEISSAADQELPYGFGGGLGLTLAPSETLDIAVVDLDSSALMIIGDHLSDGPQADLDTLFNHVVASVRFR